MPYSSMYNILTIYLYRMASPSSPSSGIGLEQAIIDLANSLTDKKKLISLIMWLPNKFRASSPLVKRIGSVLAIIAIVLFLVKINKPQPPPRPKKSISLLSLRHYESQSEASSLVDENRSKKSRPSFSKNNHRYITDVDTDPHYNQSQNISQEELKRDRFFFNMISSYQQSRRHESS